MPITYTGRNVKPNSNAYPSLVDIAVGLSRLPRFAGQGWRWYSVLDHSLFADELVQRTALLPFQGVFQGDESHARRRWRLAVLLHDAHEAMTSDVPTPYKTDELRREQEQLDHNIFAAYYPVDGIWIDHPDMKNAVKWIDRRALHAEARVIGPPAEPERILNAFGASEDTPADIEALKDLLFRYYFGRPPYIVDQENHPGVEEYLRRVLELM